MSELSIFPADIAEMSVSQLANLSPEQLVQVDTNLDQAITWLKAARTKLDSALEQRFGTQGRESLQESGRDFGTAHVSVDGLRVKFDLPKKVSWDQNKLKAIAQRIVSSGEAIEDYIDMKLSISESRYTNWPATLQKQFSEARTVQAGKPVFTLNLDEGQA